MTKYTSSRTCHRIGAVCFLIIVMIGCAGRLPWYGNEQNGFRMEYRFPKDKGVTYDVAFIQSMIMERGGQSWEIGSHASGQFVMNNTGVNENNDPVIHISIPTLNATEEGPQGERTIDASQVLGKSFQMAMTSQGVIKKFSGHDSLNIDLRMEGPGRDNAKDFIQYFIGDFFPVVPEDPKTVGESWTHHSEMSDDLGNIHVITTYDSKYTLLGIEEVQGNPCLKVKAEITGILEGDGEGGRLTLEGDLDCEAVYYWDYKKGILSKYDYKLFGEATMAMTNMGTSSYVLENEMTISLMK